MIRTSKFLGIVILVAVNTLSSAAEKAKDSADQNVDSGSFGIFINGQRVATETFSIVKNANGSVTKSQFRTDSGEKAEQTSELQVSQNGELKRYEWKEISPGQAQATVTPNDTFLIERSTKTAQEKAEEHPFLLSSSTSILDDYFFVHRELLAWKYMASACRQQNGQLQCPVGQKAQFGTLNPHARSSMLVSLEVVGQEKVNLKGADREMSRLTLKGEGGEWTIWVDDQFKVQKMAIPQDNTEIVRD